MRCLAISEPWSAFRTLHYHLTKLQHRLYIRVIGYVAPDLLRVRAAGCLESFDRSADEVALGHVNRVSAGSTTCDALVHRVVQTCSAEPLFHHWHMPLAVVRMIESSACGVRVHDTDFDHRVFSCCCIHAQLDGKGARLLRSRRVPPC